MYTESCKVILARKMTSFLIKNLLDLEKSVADITKEERQLEDSLEKEKRYRAEEIEEKGRARLTKISTCWIAPLSPVESGNSKTRHWYSAENYNYLQKQHISSNHSVIRGAQIAPVDCFCTCEVCSCLICYDWYCSLKKIHPTKSHPPASSNNYVIYANFQEKGTFYSYDYY